MKGFTLIESVITCALIILLGLIANSSTTHWLGTNDSQMVIDEIKAAVHYAKIQALLRDQPVFLTPISHWSGGIELHYLNPKTHSQERLYQWQWHHPRLLINWVGMGSTDRIVLSNNPLHAISNGRFIIKNLRTQDEKHIILNRLGRIRVSE